LRRRHILERAAVAFAIFALAAPVHAQEATARHLLAGVRAFKAGRYEEALVELRVVVRFRHSRRGCAW